VEGHAGVRGIETHHIVVPDEVLEDQSCRKTSLGGEWFGGDDVEEGEGVLGLGLFELESRLGWCCLSVSVRVGVRGWGPTPNS
jgi:hypothetical protein